jgi:hypothetical protein
LNRIGQHIRKSSAPFGGISILVVGEYCFTLNNWEEIFDFGINLTHIHRSKDTNLNTILRTIRKGHKLKPNMIKALESRISIYGII